MLADLGHICLVGALATSLWAIAASLLGARTGDGGLVASGRRGLHAVALLAALAVAVLLRGFLIDDFSLEFVASHSSTTLPLQYKVTALWAGQAGSILFWLLIVCVLGSLAVHQHRNREVSLIPWVVFTLGIVECFFLVVLNFSESPFRVLANPPAEGRGMNPQLQNYWQMIHPPALYLGFTSVTVPFAFAMGALLSGRLGTGWIVTIRRWTVFSWFALTMGILTGSYWAYVELGWGGYWAWDPVENASFMPWLFMTAFLHSVMIQERKGMMKIWNLLLIIGAYALTIFGTFLTRSGVIESVHAFALSNIGTFFGTFLVLVLAGSIALVVWRRPALRSEQRLESAFSRESSFLFNNLLLLAVCFAVLLGTTFPILSEWVKGSKAFVGPPFFNLVVPPIAILLLLLAGACPLIAWRKASLSQTLRSFLWPVVGTVAVLGVLAFAGLRAAWGYIGFGSGVFVLGTILQEYVRGTAVWVGRGGRSLGGALFALVSRDRRRYGGYLIHAGVVVFFAGVTAVGLWKEERAQVLRPGESVQIAGYTISYKEFWIQTTPHRKVEGVRLLVQDRNGRPLRTMMPERSFFATFPEQPVTEISLLPMWRGDLYAVSEELLGDGSARIHLFWNPLIGLLWLGGIVMAFGTLIAVLPGPEPVTVRARAPDAVGEGVTP